MFVKRIQFKFYILNLYLELNNDLTNKAKLKPLFNELTGEDSADFIIINYQTETADFPDSPQHALDNVILDNVILDNVSKIYFAYFYFVIY